MLKIGESISYINDPASFINIYTGSPFTLSRYSKKITLLSFIEINNGWKWIKRLANIQSNPDIGEDFQFIAVIFKITPGSLTDGMIKNRLSSHPELKDIDFSALPNFVIAKDQAGTSQLNDKYATIYSNYILNDGPHFHLKSPGYVCYSYIVLKDIICDKWHTNCTAFEITGSLTKGSPVIEVPDTSRLSTGDSISGAGLPVITAIKSIDSKTIITLDKNASETSGSAILTIGSGDPVSFNRIKISGEPQFNSRDFASAEKYVLRRLANLKNSPAILGARPENGSLLHALDSVNIIFSKPLADTATDKSKYTLSGEGRGALFVTGASCEGINLIENILTLRLSRAPSMGDLVITADAGVTDTDGNPVQDGANTIGYSFDISPPVITSFINNSGSPTSRDSISFRLEGYDNIGIARWTVNESPSPLPADDPLWRPNNGPDIKVSSTHMFSPGTGTKRIYAWVMDEAGNINRANNNSYFEVIYDTGTPTVSSFAPLTCGPTNESRIHFTLTCRENVTITGWKITESSNKPGAGDAGWLDNPPSYYDLRLKKSGMLSLYAWAMDAEGNISSCSEDTHFEVIYDIDPPAILKFSPASKAPTSGRYIAFDRLEGADNFEIAGWMITQSRIKPEAHNSEWLKSRPAGYTLNIDSSATVTLYAWIKDGAGNVSAINDSSHFNVVYDIDPPVITTFIPAGKGPTSDKRVNIAKLKGSDNVKITGWMITQSVKKPFAGDPGWLPSRPDQYAIEADNDARITLYAWAKDRAGNVSHQNEKTHFDVEYVAPRPLLEVKRVSPALEISSGDTVCLDDVVTGRSGVCLFSIRNTGKAEMTVTGLSLSGGGAFTINPAPLFPFTLKPKGKSVTVSIQFAPAAIRRYRAAIVIKSSGPHTKKFTLTLSGKGVPAIGVMALTENNGINSKTPIYNGDIFDMGAAITAAETSLDIHITNNSDSKITVRSISINGVPKSVFSLGHIPRIPATIAPGGTLPAIIVFSRGLNGKQYKGIIGITSTDAKCRHFSFKVKARGAKNVLPLKVKKPLKKKILKKQQPVKNRQGQKDKKAKSANTLKKSEKKVKVKKPAKAIKKPHTAKNLKKEQRRVPVRKG